MIVTRVDKWLIAFLAVLHLLPFLRLVGVVDGGRIFGGVAVISIIPVALAARYLLDPATRTAPSVLDRAILLYAVVSILSYYSFLLPDNPADPFAYVYGIYLFVLPISCYFAARSLSVEGTGRVILALVVLNTFALGLGVYMHVARPAYYAAFVTEQVLAGRGYAESTQFFARMQSYIGSTAIGTVAATTVVLVSFLSSRRWALSVLAIGVAVAAAALSLERGGITATFLALVFFLTRGRRPSLVPVTGTALVGIALVYGASQAGEAGILFKERLVDRVTVGMIEAVEGLATERGYAPGFEYVTDFPLGVGLGATSSAAASAGLAPRGEVVDANYMRIAADLGILGFAAFTLLILTAFRAAWNTNDRRAWMVFLVIYLGIMVGTNTLDSYYVSHSFWLALGILDVHRQNHARQ